MHTFTSGPHKMNDGRMCQVTINYNGDFSGDAKLEVLTVSTNHSFQIDVPCEALVQFAQNATLDMAIEALEELKTG